MGRSATRMERAISCPSVNHQVNHHHHPVTFHEARKPYRYINQAIPGYQGYIPSKYSETVYAGTMHAVNHRCRKDKARKISTQQVPGSARGKSEPAPHKPLHKAWDNRNIIHPAAGDYKESSIASPRRKEATADARSMALGNIPSYQGYIPGKVPENCYGETWQRSNEASLRAFGKTYDIRSMQGLNNAKGRLGRVPYGTWPWRMTYPGAPEKETFVEQPLFNPNYQNQVVGWSDCKYTGTKIDPAGRLQPTGMQESWGLKTPVLPTYRPVHALREVFAESKANNYDIAVQKFDKNRRNRLQV